MAAIVAGYVASTVVDSAAASCANTSTCTGLAANFEPIPAAYLMAVVVLLLAFGVELVMLERHHHRSRS